MRKHAEPTVRWRTEPVERKEQRNERRKRICCSKGKLEQPPDRQEPALTGPLLTHRIGLHPLWRAVKWAERSANTPVGIPLSTWHQLRLVSIRCVVRPSVIHFVLKSEGFQTSDFLEGWRYFLNKSYGPTVPGRNLRSFQKHSNLQKTSIQKPRTELHTPT